MNRDLIIGIDSSTSATKATAWDGNGAFMGEGRCAIPMSNPAPGRFEQDPNDWWSSTVAALKQLLSRVDSRRVAAASISNQRETFGAFDARGEPTRKGIVWLDERALAQSEALARKVGAERIREICGKPVDVIVPINRMIWLREEEPEIFAATERYADVHCYLAFRLIGRWITSTASADPSGMLDLRSGQWSRELLSQAGIPLSLMPELAAPGEPIGEVGASAAAQTGLPEGLPVIAGGGDGQCAACGAGAVEPSHAYMNLGTAIVSGVYSPSYGHDMAFRTETAVCDEGYIFETVLRSGTFLIDWFVREMAGIPESGRLAFLGEIEEEARASPIGAGGIVALPFWQGSMTPHWDPHARGVIAGLSGSAGRGDVYRALLEGLALDQAFALEKAMAATGGEISRITAIGGGAASSLLLRVIADSMNVPVHRGEASEASGLGAAMCAAKGIGWHSSLREASRAMRQKDLDVAEPDAENVERYARLREVYDELWPSLSDWNRRLRSFADEARPSRGS